MERLIPLFIFFALFLSNAGCQVKSTKVPKIETGKYGMKMIVRFTNPAEVQEYLLMAFVAREGDRLRIYGPGEVFSAGHRGPDYIEGRLQGDRFEGKVKLNDSPVYGEIIGEHQMVGYALHGENSRRYLDFTLNRATLQASLDKISTASEYGKCILNAESAAQWEACFWTAREAQLNKKL